MEEKRSSIYINAGLFCHSILCHLMFSFSTGDTESTVAEIKAGSHFYYWYTVKEN